MDREAWRAAVHEVKKSQTRLRDWTELNRTDPFELGRGREVRSLVSRDPAGAQEANNLALQIDLGVIYPLWTQQPGAIGLQELSFPHSFSCAYLSKNAAPSLSLAPTMGLPSPAAGCPRAEASHWPSHAFQSLGCPSHPWLPGKPLIVPQPSVHISPPPAPSWIRTALLKMFVCVCVW